MTQPENEKRMSRTILAFSGSLRAQSTNAALLEAIRLLPQSRCTVSLFDGIQSIPAFNPDFDVEPAHSAVMQFRSAVQQADACVFSCSEYAHGIPSALKNALEWTVSTGEFDRKPVTLVDASSRSEFAQASLREILRTMGARLIPSAEVTIPLLGSIPSPAAIIERKELRSMLECCLGQLLDAVDVSLTAGGIDE